MVKVGKEPCIESTSMLNPQLEQYLQSIDDDEGVSSLDDEKQIRQSPSMESSCNVSTAFSGDGERSALSSAAFAVVAWSVGFACSHLLRERWFGVSSELSSVAGFLAILLGLIATASLVPYSWSRWQAWQKTRQMERVYQSRQEMALVLGAIGAPVLTVGFPRITCGPLSLLEDVCRETASLLQAVDAVLLRLQSATSLRWGLGHWSLSVDRVERSLYRRQPQAALTLPRVRRVVSGVLYTACERFARLVDEPVVDERPVSTLSRLRHLREQVAELLVAVLERGLGGGTVDQDALQQAVQAAQCHRWQLRAACQELDEPWTSTGDLEPPLWSLQQHVDSLQLALTGLQEASTSEQDETAQSERAAWWSTVKGLAEDFVTRVEQIDSTHFGQPEPETKASNTQGVPGSACRPTQAADKRPKDEYVADGDNACSANTVARSPSVKEGKTLVYLGKGARSRRKTKNVVSDEEADEERRWGFDSEHYLIRELQKHLMTFPQAEERISLQLMDDEEEATLDNLVGDVDDNEKATIRVMPASGSFLGELETAMMTLSSDSGPIARWEAND